MKDNKTLQLSQNRTKVQASGQRISQNQNNEEMRQQTEKEMVPKDPNAKESCQLTLLHKILIVAAVVVVVVVIIVVIVVVTRDDGKKKPGGKNSNNPPVLDENNYISVTLNEDFVFPADKKVQIVGADFPHKEDVIIIGRNNKVFKINNEGKIEDVTKDDFPLSFNFNATISNGSYLFKDVKCFKSIDLSKMDSSQMIDASNMFENAEFEEIYFGTENLTNSENKAEQTTDDITSTDSRRQNIRNLDEMTNIVLPSNDYNDYDEEMEEEEMEEEEEEEKRKEYFDTANIRSASNIFRNCAKLKKVQLPPSFNVGKSAKGMFKGCTKLEEVNTTLISSTEVEEMESMFEDCSSLKAISFSNDFLTGEIKSLNGVFKNTNLLSLDMSYLRLYNLESISNIFEGAKIEGNLTIGKYYSNDNLRDNLFKEIAKVTEPSSTVFTPSGTTIDQVFQNIYSNERHTSISVKVIDIDYNIHYKEDEDYKIYSDILHFGLGWDFDSNNTYDLDSSVVTFNSNIDYLKHVYFGHLEEYGGAIHLSGDDLTGEGEGDDEEINVTLSRLPSDVEMFTVQLNSYRGNSLKNVKSAYIRLSADSDVIGTYSINDAGNNIGLLIGCFFKNSENEWYFKPLNKVIPGNEVTMSINAIQEILHFMYDNRLISARELVKRLIIVANGRSFYSQEPKFNSLYWNGTHWSADCSNLIKSLINGREVINPKRGSYQKKFPVVEDINANALIEKCKDVSTDFTKLETGVPRLLHLKDNQGNGHVGIYLGQTLSNFEGNANVIEATTSWGANAIIYSWVDRDGTRRRYEDGPLSEMKYNWTSHGSLEQWVWTSKTLNENSYYDYFDDEYY